MLHTKLENFSSTSGDGLAATWNSTPLVILIILIHTTPNISLFVLGIKINRLVKKLIYFVQHVARV